MLSEHLPGEPTSFYVIPYHEPRNQIKLTAKNRDQKRLWAQHIKGVILEKFDNIPNRAKELVYKLGDEEGMKTHTLTLTLTLMCACHTCITSEQELFSWAVERQTYTSAACHCCWQSKLPKLFVFGANKNGCLVVCHVNLSCCVF